MGKAFLITTIVLFSYSAWARDGAGLKREKSDDSVARVQVEKKHAVIDRYLKQSAKFRLSYIISNIYESVKNGKSIDCYAFAHTEVTKHFSAASAEQKDVLIFYAIAGALKKLEVDIEELRERSETSTVFDNLNFRANELFDVLSSIFLKLKGVSAKTVADVI